MKRSQINKEEGQALIDQWKSSGKSIKEYCLEAQIPTHRLHYWKGKCESKKIESSGNKFLPIELESDRRGEIEIQTPGGYKIRLSGIHSLMEIINILN